MASSRHESLIQTNPQIASLELMMGRKKDPPVALIKDQNDCVRAVNVNNELVLTSPSTDPTSFFVEEERVNMAERDGFANALPSPPLGIEAAGLAAGGNAGVEIFAVSCERGGSGGPIGRGIPLGSPVRGSLISSSGGGGLSSSSDNEERAESGDGGSSEREKGPPKAMGIGLTSKGRRVRGGSMGLGVTSLPGSSGDLCCGVAGD
jgi:hypothetical protein